MGQKLLTEAEWRKLVSCRKRTSPLCWGARCYFPYARRNRFLHSRILRRTLIGVTLSVGILLPLLAPSPVPEAFVDQPLFQSPAQPTLRSVSAISYQMPTLETTRQIFTRSELARGKMLLLDEDHPLPQDAPAPNTFSIARTASGTIPVRSLETKTGQETIAALEALFVQLRTLQTEGLCVARGAVTPVQQQQMRITSMRRLMHSHPPETASCLTNQTLEMPGSSEMLLEYAVEFDLMQPHDTVNAPEECPQGQLLLRTAWRLGFIRTNSSYPWRFRYVGKAHAAAMTYLAADLPAYLSWLHQKEVLVVSDGRKPIYLILCTQMNGDYAAFDLPVGCSYEVSMDNTGYALAACTL